MYDQDNLDLMTECCCAALPVSGGSNDGHFACQSPALHGCCGHSPRDATSWEERIQSQAHHANVGVDCCRSGRAVYQLSLQTSRTIYESRK